MPSHHYRSSVGAVTERNASEWLAYFEESRVNPNAKLPKTYLMALPDLLKAVRKPHSAGDGRNALGVTISDSEMKWLKRFHNDIRNQFVHFEPLGWSIEVSGISEIAKLVARIIEGILRIGWAFRHQNFAQLEKMEGTLKSLAVIKLSAKGE